MSEHHSNGDLCVLDCPCRDLRAQLATERAAHEATRRECDDLRMEATLPLGLASCALCSITHGQMAAKDARIAEMLAALVRETRGHDNARSGVRCRCEMCLLIERARRAKGETP